MRTPLLLAFWLLLMPSNTAAEMWVNADDYGLRADIQHLADAGVILAPVTTYPLMWNSFIDTLKKTESGSLTVNLQHALSRVLATYNQETSKTQHGSISSFISTDSRTVTSFGMPHFGQSEISASLRYSDKNIAAKVTANYRQDGRKCLVANATHDMIVTEEQVLENCDDSTFDNSYIAYQLGNWVLRAGAIAQFWGPGIDGSLILSTNTKPLRAVSLSRDRSTAFDLPVLHWLGPWTFTSQMAKLEKQRVVPEALLWSTRLNFRPMRQLEAGVAWSVQWGGLGQPSGFNQFVDIITGDPICADNSTACNDALDTKIGNQLAGIDVRWSDTFFSHPYALYVSTIGEDASRRFKPADKAYLFGAQTTAYFAEQAVVINIEYTDTAVSCAGDGSTVENCYYEHSTYLSGYRYHGRPIGASFDNDTQAIVLTLLGQLANGNDWQVKIRQIKYNSDTSDKFPNNPDLGHSVSKTALTSTQIEGRYRFNALSGRWMVGAQVANNNDDAMRDANVDASCYLKYEYRF